MAELADALASGASGSNIVEVRVLLTASYQQKQVSDLPIQVDWKPVFLLNQVRVLLRKNTYLAKY
jgi:hypothetical protein